MATKPERKTVKLQMFLFRKADGTDSFRSYDLTEGNTDERWISALGACMGQVEIIGTYEDIQGDARAIVIAGLEKAIHNELADSKRRVNLLLERISQLKCITHESAS